MPPGSVARDSRYAALGKQDLDFFKRTLGQDAVLTNPEALQQHNKDWMGKFHGQSRVVLQPKTTKQVSRILAYCNQHCLAVVPQVKLV